ncbi:uncharacterized protein LOC128557981 [Mercenaria mercenaria]|uniref:uncharacterized protein LOC128557981 n=1 Tax=Mercenaria mercenaria TaxID=6596 RepID=UPI00234E8635|nr:uncharacterized protein LOC128557981 [Mercenaria mercenaria]
MRFHMKRICIILVLILVFMITFFYVLNPHKEIQRDARISVPEKEITEDIYNNDSADRMRQEEENNNNTNHTDNRELKPVGQPVFVNINRTKTGKGAQLGQLPSSGTCNRTIFPAYLKTEEIWQPVDSNKTMYVFSAYYVKARKGVFVIGVKPRRPVKVICKLWMWNKNKGFMELHEAVGEVRAPHEGFGQKYTSTIFMCPISQSEMPKYISLVTNFCEYPLNMLHVNNASGTGSYKRRFTVCLSPLNFKYGRAYELVEWIEFNKILGADKFVVYNYSSASNVKEVFEHYSKSNLTEVIQWRLPMGVNTFPKTNNPVEINYFGQTAALNDCLFRNKQFSEFVVNIDLDEFIVPHSEKAGNWYEIIKEMENASVYMFKNTFFRKDWAKIRIPFRGKKLAEQLRLVTLQVFQHEAKIFPARERSKYIARTADVDLMLIHEVPHSHEVLVPIEKGILHHYRDWNNPNDDNEKVTDITILNKFETSLTENVGKVWKELAHVKMDMPII